MPHLPRPPLLPPPPALRRMVTLHANSSRRTPEEEAEAAQASVPPPPAGPPPEEHLRMAIEFMNSLNDLERDAAAMRGTLGPLKHIVGVHIMNLRNEFRLVL